VVEEYMLLANYLVAQRLVEVRQGGREGGRESGKETGREGVERKQGREGSTTPPFI